MKREEVAIYREIQKNAEMAITTLDTISDKVYDDTFALQIARESLKYSDIRNKVVDKILQGKAEPYNSNFLTGLMIKSGIHINTALNTSTSHIADLLIRKSNRGIIDMCKLLNRYPELKGQAMEMAKEFIDFEEKNIERLKKYL